MRERLQKFINSEQLSPTRFADEIGVQRSGISHILAGRNNPSFDVIQKILSRFRNLNAEWLLLGTGNMYKTLRQGSLFDQPESLASQITQKSGDLSKESDPINAKISGNYTENVPENTSHNSSTPIMDKDLGQIIQSVKDNKQVVRIIVLYADKSFDTYHPSVD